MPNTDDPLFGLYLIGFAIALSLFYYWGVKAGHKQAKHLYDSALAGLEKRNKELRECLEYVVTNSAEGRRMTANFREFRAAREEAAPKDELGPKL